MTGTKKNVVDVESMNTLIVSVPKTKEGNLRGNKGTMHSAVGVMKTSLKMNKMTQKIAASWLLRNLVR